MKHFSTALCWFATLLCWSANAQQPLDTATGAAAAPVSILVFVDLECPFSASTIPAVEKIANQYPGQVRLELRQFPLAQHEHASLAHEAALAAGAQGRYLAMVDLIQANQTHMDRAQFLRYATLLKLDGRQFAHDLDTHRFAAQVQSDIAVGRALGVDTTPTLFVNGQRFNGAQDGPAINASVQRALQASPASQPAGVATTALSSADIAALAFNPTAARGSAEAPVTIVEFTDFQCPFCRRAADPLRQLLAQSGSNVRWVYRSYPLDFHDHAEAAAEAALAAGDQGKFWPMHDLLFANQSTLDREHFNAFAKQLGLDVPRFDEALNSGRFRAQIATDRALGQKYGVDGTPAFFINGRPISGARTLPELQQAVQLAMGAEKPSSLAIASTDTHHLVAGETSSPIHVEWFVDTETAVALAVGATLQQLAANNAVQIAFHSYTLPSHPNAALASRALIAAAAEGKFWPLYNALAGQPLPQDDASARTAILAAAKSLGLNAEKIGAAFDDPQLTDDLAADREEAYRRGIRGVPVIFIDGKRIDGLQPASVYQQYVNASAHTEVAATTK